MKQDQIVIELEGMRCGYCENVLTQAIYKLRGILYVSASFNESIVDVVYDADEVREEEIRWTIHNEGFESKNICHGTMSDSRLCCQMWYQ